MAIGHPAQHYRAQYALALASAMNEFMGGEHAENTSRNTDGENQAHDTERGCVLAQAYGPENGKELQRHINIEESTIAAGIRSCPNDITARADELGADESGEQQSDRRKRSCRPEPVVEHRDRNQEQERAAI